CGYPLPRGAGVPRKGRSMGARRALRVPIGVGGQGSGISARRQTLTPEPRPLTPATEGSSPLLEVRGLSRAFSGVLALQGYNLRLQRRSPGSPLTTLLSTPGFRRQERDLEVGAMELLDLVGLAHLRDRVARSLPYGDQRRLEIARAIALRPTVLLLDEPSAGM